MTLFYSVIIYLVIIVFSNLAMTLFSNDIILNNKSELMLMRRATASVLFRTQVVLVYLQYSASEVIRHTCAIQIRLLLLLLYFSENSF